MIAAFYARKSTDDSDRNEEARSTTRQVERATEYARAKGWTVDPRRFGQWRERRSAAPLSKGPALSKLLFSVSRAKLWLHYSIT